jgi:hypothetical protein
VDKEEIIVQMAGLNNLFVTNKLFLVIWGGSFVVPIYATASICHIDVAEMLIDTKKVFSKMNTEFSLKVLLYQACSAHHL